MKTSLFVLSLSLLLVSCRTSEPFICGTALFAEALRKAEEEAAQRSLFVFADSASESDLTLVVSLEVPDEGAKGDCVFYFRKKGAGESVSTRYKDLPLLGSAPGSALLTLLGDDLRVAVSTCVQKEGVHANSGIHLVASFRKDFSSRRLGMTIRGLWLEKNEPNKAPEPTITAVTSAAAQPRVPAALVAHL